jgi:uncharacterized protein YuzE
VDQSLTAPELPFGVLGLWQPSRMEGTYDPEIDAAYLWLIPKLEPGSSKRQVVATRELAGELVFDLDEDGRVLAIEVLDATAVLRPETIAQLRRLATP